MSKFKEIKMQLDTYKIQEEKNFSYLTLNLICSSEDKTPQKYTMFLAEFEKFLMEISDLL